MKTAEVERRELTAELLTEYLIVGRQTAGHEAEHQQAGGGGQHYGRDLEEDDLGHALIRIR